MRILKVEISRELGITVENRGPARGDPHGPDLFAVCCLGECLSRTGRWRHEPRPSEMTESFRRCTRFPYDEAIIRAERAACILEGQ